MLIGGRLIFGIIRTAVLRPFGGRELSVIKLCGLFLFPVKDRSFLRRVFNGLLVCGAADRHRRFEVRAFGRDFGDDVVSFPSFFGIGFHFRRVMFFLFIMGGHKTVISSN